MTAARAEAIEKAEPARKSHIRELSQRTNESLLHVPGGSDWLDRHGAELLALAELDALHAPSNGA